MKLHLRGSDPMKFDGDALILGHFEDICPLTGFLGQLDWILNASISNLWKKKPDLLQFGTVTLLATQGKISASQVLLVGLGSRDKFNREMRREAFALGFCSAAGIGVERLAIEAFPVNGDYDRNIDEDLIKAFSSTGNASGGKLFLYVDSPEILTVLSDRIKDSKVDPIVGPG